MSVEEKISRTGVPKLGLDALRKLGLEKDYRDWIQGLVWLDKRLDEMKMDCYSAISNTVYKALDAGVVIMSKAREAHEKHIVTDPEYDEIEHAIEFPIWETMGKAAKLCRRSRESVG